MISIARLFDDSPDLRKLQVDRRAPLASRGTAARGSALFIFAELRRKRHLAASGCAPKKMP